MPLDDSFQRDPNGRTERIIYWAFMILILGLFVAAYVENTSPRKLSVPFFLFSWMVLVAIHEFGHALMAWIVGWGVHRIVVGFGKPVFRFQIRGVPVEFCVFPISGYVEPHQKDLVAPRFKDALIYAAGPGIEIVIAFVLATIVGFTTMFTRTDHLGILFIQSFAVAALAGAILNLIPMPIQANGGWIANDGLGIIQSMRRSDADYRKSFDPNS
ncbi:site-2 protease family protein [bacterium]|nr:site-2 protease family protein [bacterium]